MQNIPQIGIRTIAGRIDEKQLRIYFEREEVFFVTKNMYATMVLAHRDNSHHFKVKMFYWFIVLVHT